MCARQLVVIIALLALGTGVSVVVALVLPQWYSASVQLVPPRSKGLGGGAGLLGTASQALPLEALGISGQSDGGLLVGLLQSRTVSDAVITRFDLKSVYRKRTIEETRIELASHVQVNLDRKSSLVTVDVEDRTPQRARDMADFLAGEANGINNSLEMRRSGQERIFLEGRLAEVRKDLARAEVTFKEYQAKHGFLDVGEQTRATVRTIANLQAELMSRQIQLSYVASFAGGGEQNASRIRREMAEIRRQLDKYEKASPSSQPGPDGRHVIASVGNIPELALDYTRLLRDLKIQEAVFELLTKQYELAKLGEARDTANAQIVDRAVLPTRRSRPKRGGVVFIGLLLSAAVAFGAARLRDRYQTEPAFRGHVKELREALGRPRPQA
jgi:tyrosine-protein kinase Etk/Wzc